LTVSTCPGDTACSGHGVCPTDGTFKCQCNTGYSGGDCSSRLCPMGKSWFDYPIANEVAHTTLIECSNMVNSLYLASKFYAKYLFMFTYLLRVIAILLLVSVPATLDFMGMLANIWRVQEG